MEKASLRAAIGQRVKELRGNLRQEIVALCARRWGLKWVRSTVAQIEIGHRHLTAEEWIILPAILNEAGIRADQEHEITYTTLIPREWHIAFSAQTHIPGGILIEMLDHNGVVPPGDADKIDRPQTRLQQVFTNLAAGQRPMPLDTDATDADRKAAWQLGVPLPLLTQAAFATWKRSLVEEREERFRLSGGEIMAPRRAQAVRGTITRKLLKEIRAALAALGVRFEGERRGKTNKRRKA